MLRTIVSLWFESRGPSWDVKREFDCARNFVGEYIWSRPSKTFRELRRAARGTEYHFFSTCIEGGSLDGY